MNAISVSPAEARTTILVWDAPVRVFHWLMVLCFALAYATSESERWRLLHVTLGYTMVGLVGFRMLWGLIGTRHARFGAFVRRPSVVRDYLLAMLRGHPHHHVGHNPVGALSILAVLLLTLLIGASGWFVYNTSSGEWFAELHEAVANTLLGVVGLHLVGVLASSVMHRENLAHSMVTGRKFAETSQGIARAWWSVAMLLVLVIAAFWWLQWRNAAL